MTKLKITFIILLFIFAVNLIAQSNLQSSYGFNRINQNINFFIDVNSQLKTGLGDFDIQQNYFGNSYLPTKSINDNQKFELNWKKKILNNFYLMSKQRIDYIGNNFSSEINNDLLNVKFLPGVMYEYDENRSVNFNYGYDHHSQLGIESFTPAFNLNSKYNYQIDEFNLESSLEHFNTQRTMQRNYILNDIKLNLSRVVDNSRLNINSSYNDLENDFATFNQNIYQIEDRNETKVNLGLDVSYNLIENLTNEVSISYLSSSRNNSYREFDKNNLRSGIYEIRSLDGYNLFTKFNYKYSKSLLRASFQKYTESLDNSIKNKFLTNDNDLISQQNNISLLDYQNSYSRIILENNFKLDYNNLFISEFFYEINRYDTPSKNENRDRDQIIIKMNQKYEHIFSDFFTFGLELEARFRHLVYLKGENSINNIKERSLKLAPYYKYKNKKLEMTPEFQIFVNFRSYDYEYLFQNIRSDAQRSLTFKDSINYYINYKYRFNLSYIYRYRETGLFNWEKFSQSIFEVKNEFYLNMLFYLHKQQNYYGLGIRYYKLNLDNNRNVGNLGNSSFLLNSISPVVDFGIKLQERTKLVVYGWYEYQKNNGNLRIIPNLKLETQINLY